MLTAHGWSGGEAKGSERSSAGAGSVVKAV